MRPIYNLSSNAPTRFKRPQIARRNTKRKPQSLTTTMGFFATAGLVTACMLGALGWGPDFDFSGRRLEASNAAKRAATESQAGLILFTSPNVDSCRQQVFDNSTGRQHDDGVVDCKFALYRVKQSQIVSRLNAIGDGFRQK
jgi:hypothetical protein